MQRKNLVEDIKNKAVQILVEIQRDYPALQAIYLWGSILTDDFDPQTSDIDSIAFVREDTDLGLKDKLNKILGELLPRLQINFLYQSALNGEQLKAITNFVPAESLLYDLPNWIHVAGKTLHKEDFVLGRVELNSVIDAVHNNIKTLFESRIKENGERYVVKGLARLCYLIHMKNLPFKVFRYSDLVQDATDETHQICEKIIMIKKAGYSRDSIIENLPLFRDFLNRDMH